MEAGTRKLQLIAGFMALGVGISFGISISEILDVVISGSTKAEEFRVLVPACSTLIGLQVGETSVKRLAAKKGPASKEEGREGGVMEAGRNWITWLALVAGVVIGNVVWYVTRAGPAKVPTIRVISVLAGVVAGRGLYIWLKARAARKKETELAQSER